MPRAAGWEVPAPQRSGSAVPFADTLRVLERHLPAALVSPGAFRSVAAMAARVPAALSNWGYLESRLQDEASRVDLILRIGAGGRAILAGDNPAIVLPGSLATTPVWSRIRALARGWSARGSLLQRVVRVLWLEFDAEPGAGASAGVLSPGVFMGFRHPPVAGGSRSGRAHDALAALDLLFAGRVPPAVARGLARCCARLPAGALVPYVGVFPHRGGPAVRLCIAGLDPASLTTLLHALGCTSARGPVPALLAGIQHARRHAGAPGPMLLHLDVAGDVDHRVGIEYVFSRPEQLGGHVAETGFLDHLEALGLCSPAKRSGLSAWAGHSTERLPHELWRSLLVRRLNHVKLVLDPDAPPQAKAYLSFHHVPRPRR